MPINDLTGERFLLGLYRLLPQSERDALLQELVREQFAKSWKKLSEKYICVEGAESLEHWLRQLGTVLIENDFSDILHERVPYNCPISTIVPPDYDRFLDMLAAGKTGDADFGEDILRSILYYDGVNRGPLRNYDQLPTELDYGENFVHRWRSNLIKELGQASSEHGEDFRWVAPNRSGIIFPAETFSVIVDWNLEDPEFGKSYNKALVEFFQRLEWFHLNFESGHEESVFEEVGNCILAAGLEYDDDWDDYNKPADLIDILPLHHFRKWDFKPLEERPIKVTTLESALAGLAKCLSHKSKSKEWFYISGTDPFVTAAPIIDVSENEFLPTLPENVPQPDEYILRLDERLTRLDVKKEFDRYSVIHNNSEFNHALRKLEHHVSEHYHGNENLNKALKIVNETVTRLCADEESRSIQSPWQFKWPVVAESPVFQEVFCKSRDLIFIRRDDLPWLGKRNYLSDWFIALCVQYLREIDSSFAI